MGPLRWWGFDDSEFDDSENDYTQSVAGGRNQSSLVFDEEVWKDRCEYPMRKSSEVPLTILAAAAMLTIGCRDEPRHCVDAQNHLMPDSTCEAHSTGYGGYHYVYGGSSGGHYGDMVLGSSVSRGGFGHGGGGEGGGE
jgi:hypothetical protein